MKKKQSPSDMRRKIYRILNRLPIDIVKIVHNYLIDIIIDDIPYSQCSVNRDMFMGAESVHFFPSFRLYDGVQMPCLKRLSGVPTIVATRLVWLFRHSQIGNVPDLAKWDMSKVCSIQGMFDTAQYFNTDLSEWDVSNVRYMYEAFNRAYEFNCDISKWDVSNVRCMVGAFSHTYKLDADLREWNVSPHCAVDFAIDESMCQRYAPLWYR